MQTEAEIVMQPGGGMLLNDERQGPRLSCRACAATWLGGLAEVAHRAIARKLFVDHAGGGLISALPRENLPLSLPL